jgi:hypothetical protein
MRSVIDQAASEIAFDNALLRVLELPLAGRTTAELWALWERYELTKAKLAAREYELTSPFLWRRQIT